MEECIFCKIARKEIPAKIVYENDDVIAFLDIRPRSKGMCLVVPKKHFVAFDEDMDTASKTFDAALIVAKKIKEALQPLAVFISMIPGQVNHFHVRVYPVFQDQIPLIENKPLEVTEEELASLAEKISGVDVEWKREAKIQQPPNQEEKVEEKKDENLSEEDVWWIKRELVLG